MTDEAGIKSPRNERLYAIALDTRFNRQIGTWLPKIRALATRGDRDAMTDLADWCSGQDRRSEMGSLANPASPAGLYLRAYRQGSVRAAENMAISCFNRRDLIGYRYWLVRAARAGSADAERAVRRFEIRSWHGAARGIGRLRPRRKRDGLA
ncbi:MAG: hypothetical protein K2X76_10120 [Sphingomonas sp.]|nr:hypothetical protein [Sphingomonas sp.]